MSAPSEQYAPDPDFDPETGEVLDSDAPDNGGWDKGRHCITDLRGANWAGLRLREAQEQIRLCKAMFHAEADELVRKLDAAGARMDAAAKPFLQTQEFMENAIRTFASTPEGKAEVLKGLRKKSRLLPCGVTIRWREQKAGYRYDQRPGPSGRPPTPAENKAALLEWARGLEDGQDFIAKIEVPDLDAIKEHLRELDAEEARDVDATPAPPGLEYVPPGETLTVSVGEEESK